jgi:hypothetical protein
MANSKNFCSAVNCNNKRCKCPGLSFFRFPRDPKRFVYYDVHNHVRYFAVKVRMIYSANHPVYMYLYQLVATDFVCWLPVNELNFFDRMNTHNFR